MKCFNYLFIQMRTKQMYTMNKLTKLITRKYVPSDNIFDSLVISKSRQFTRNAAYTKIKLKINVID